MAFLFRANRNHGTDGRTDRVQLTLKAAQYLVKNCLCVFYAWLLTVINIIRRVLIVIGGGGLQVYGTIGDAVEDRGRFRSTITAISNCVKTRRWSSSICGTWSTCQYRQRSTHLRNGI